MDKEPVIGRVERIYACPLVLPFRRIELAETIQTVFGMAKRVNACGLHVSNLRHGKLAEIIQTVFGKAIRVDVYLTQSRVQVPLPLAPQITSS